MMCFADTQHNSAAKLILSRLRIPLLTSRDPSARLPRATDGEGIPHRGVVSTLERSEGQRGKGSPLTCVSRDKVALVKRGGPRPLSWVPLEIPKPGTCSWPQDVPRGLLGHAVLRGQPVSSSPGDAGAGDRTGCPARLAPLWLPTLHCLMSSPLFPFLTAPRTRASAPDPAVPKSPGAARTWARKAHPWTLPRRSGCPASPPTIRGSEGKLSQVEEAFPAAAPGTAVPAGVGHSPTKPNREKLPRVLTWAGVCRRLFSTIEADIAASGTRTESGRFGTWYHGHCTSLLGPQGLCGASSRPGGPGGGPGGALDGGAQSWVWSFTASLSLLPRGRVRCEPQLVSSVSSW